MGDTKPASGGPTADGKAKDGLDMSNAPTSDKTRVEASGSKGPSPLAPLAPADLRQAEPRRPTAGAAA